MNLVPYKLCYRKVTKQKTWKGWAYDILYYFSTKTLRCTQYVSGTSLLQTIKLCTSRIPPAIILFFLAPAIGELLSGSAPPVEFFNPIGFALLSALYGSGAILARELTIRWKKGYGSLLLLGAAYGVAEEGLMVKSFFDPAWPDLGILGTFGRWIGINWVWAEMLTIYHAVFSIAIPILLVELAYPTRRKECWVSNRALKGFVFLLVAVVLFGYFVLTPYRPPFPQYSLAILATILLVYLARKLPPDYGKQGTVPLRRSIFFWATGFLATVTFFPTFWLLPHLLSIPIAIMFLGALLVLVIATFLKHFNWKEPSGLHQLALISGGLTFFILLAPIQELDKTRTDNPQGMSLVALAFLTGLLLLRRQIKRHAQTGERIVKEEASERKS